jgi:UDP-N-acetylglucosamine transferase subunit ALG13
MGTPQSRRWSSLLWSCNLIFVTVGTQLPFDRLINHVDFWAAQRNDADIFGQIGRCSYHPSYFRWKKDLSPEEYNSILSQCDTIIAHAGMGTIINALYRQKKIIIFPRRGDLQEHRNDHQLATARWLKQHPGIYTATNGKELCQLLDTLDTLSPPEKISEFAPELLTRQISDFLFR